MEYLIALIALTAMEIVLGIDNIVFIAVVTGRLPAEQRPSARRLGLAMALITRILLLLTLSAIMKLVSPIFVLPNFGLPEEWISHEMTEVSWKDLIMFFGGLFLIWKSVHEIHKKLEGDEGEHHIPAKVSYNSILVQIAVLDVIFSLDSVITAVGMVKGDRMGLAVMITAIIIAVGVMLVFAGRVSDFVERHPTLKMLALSFLILIGVMLVAEGAGTHINKGYIYFAMAFSLGVEFLNLRIKSTKKHPPKTAPE